MRNGIDFWESQAAKHSNKIQTAAEYEDEHLDELLREYSLELKVDPAPDSPCFRHETDDMYDQLQELDRLLAEREEREIQAQIEAWDEAIQNAHFDEVFAEQLIVSEAQSGGFPQAALPVHQGGRAIRGNAKAIPGKNTHHPGRASSGGFPRKTTGKRSAKRVCGPGVAGPLANLFIGHKQTLAVLAELKTQLSCTDLPNAELEEEIQRRRATADFQNDLLRSIASKTSLPDWERRLPENTKLALVMLAMVQHPDAKSITFRLGHEVAETALRAKNGPTDYLARILQRLGIKDMVFVFERSDSESDENSPWHIHGIAIIPADLQESLTREPMDKDGKPKPSKLRAALAPSPDTKTTPPVRGYRQRYDNKAIDIQPARRAGGWYQYITKEIDATVHYLKTRPDYASRGAVQAGRALYEEIRCLVGKSSRVATNPAGQVGHPHTEPLKRSASAAGGEVDESILDPSTSADLALSAILAPPWS